jgi:peptide-methionine (S)-S-oxide reductase
MDTQLATFGAGCFWGVEAAYREVQGVVATTVGYAGGSVENPTYQDVCTGKTGHAEVVQVEFAPSRVAYGKLLETFWTSHDPTQLNRQGPDVGAQYRSVIFFHTPEQESAAQESMGEQQELLGEKPIVTEIAPAPTFHVAEDYHQQYLEKRGLATCRIG